MRLPRTRVQNRRGFALVLVIATIAVLLGFWAMAYRETASLIRLESSRLLNDMRGQRSVHAMTALDWALTLLEVSGTPPGQTLTYKVNVLPLNPEQKQKFFTVNFRPNSGNPHGGSNEWIVTVTPWLLPGSPSYPTLPTPPLPGVPPQWPPSP